MPTYLFTWTPGRYPILREKYREWLAGKFFEIDWSSGNNKSIPSGARVFFMRQREEPRGIFAAGYTTSDWKEREPFDGTPGIENCNDVAFEIMADPDDPPILFPRLLELEPNPKRLWSTMSSGVRIPDEVAERLESEWATAIAERGLSGREIGAGAVEDAPGEAEGRSRFVLHLIRERSRNLVARKKAQALERFGVLRCEACRRTMAEMYGPTAADLIECHHVKWLSHTGETITSLHDLALLCPNCHAVIHRGRFATVEDLRRIIAKAGKK